MFNYKTDEKEIMKQYQENGKTEIQRKPISNICYTFFSSFVFSSNQEIEVFQYVCEAPCFSIFEVLINFCQLSTRAKTRGIS